MQSHRFQAPRHASQLGRGGSGRLTYAAYCHMQRSSLRIPAKSGQCTCRICCEPQFLKFCNTVLHCEEQCCWQGLLSPAGWSARPGVESPATAQAESERLAGCER
eukprot:CAMPEP_0117589064 /NCGR_PEP_ID=MMETSP0784-20121206/70198_1 /TAXON_ID=39447 /ORGANISM="" /LENGTH=104 /DNA_ID=CAMNT_0005390491 /DNA_START=114 /DNA_END=428 /DNA_ORIENTATION=-